MENYDFVSWVYGYVSMVRLESSFDAATCWTARQREIILEHCKLVEKTTGGFVTVFNAIVLNSIDKIAWKHMESAVEKEFRKKPVFGCDEVCYFLQGYFEISEASPGYNTKQAQFILSEMDRNIDGLDRIGMATYWALRKFLQSGEKKYDTTQLTKDLNESFEHLVHV